MKFIKCWDYTHQARDNGSLVQDPHYVNASAIVSLSQWDKDTVEVRTENRTSFANGNVSVIILELSGV